MATPPALRLYNTLTREKAPFAPIDPENVRMYVCGPTVYDFAHIGNARPVIVFDVLFRLLRHLYGPEHVTYVRNITDVDDKINARSARDFPGLPLNEAIRRVTEKTAAQFEKDAAALGCLSEADVNLPGQPPRFIEPRATDNIAEMARLVQALLDGGHAYAARGDEGREVLFDILSMPDYGQLSRRPLEDQRAGARVAIEAHKRNPGDFVLWKESLASEPGWSAEFEISEENQIQLGLNSRSITIRGRPGWHIECSAMSERYLWTEIADRLSPEGQARPHQFDIHGGGLDLIFPHHENEIAQSRCAHGTPVMANVWMHNGFLQVEGRKMSKSEGNFVTIHDLLETEKFGGRKWPGEVLRLAMLMTHYREPIDFSVDRLIEASSMLSLFKSWTEKAEYLHAEPTAEFVDALSDDLNISRALVELHRLAKEARSNPGALKLDETRQLGDSFGFLPNAQLAANLRLIGIDVVTYDRDWLQKQSNYRLSEHDILQLRDARLAALEAKNFAKADAIRAELLEQGIQLMDYKDPATGERRTKWEVKR